MLKPWLRWKVLVKLNVKKSERCPAKTCRLKSGESSTTLLWEEWRIQWDWLQVLLKNTLHVQGATKNVSSSSKSLCSTMTCLLPALVLKSCNNLSIQLVQSDSIVAHIYTIYMCCHSVAQEGCWNRSIFRSALSSVSSNCPSMSVPEFKAIFFR